MSDSVGLEWDQSVYISEEFSNDENEACLRPPEGRWSKPSLLVLHTVLQFGLPKSILVTVTFLLWGGTSRTHFSVTLSDSLSCPGQYGLVLCLALPLRTLTLLQGLGFSLHNRAI